MPMQDAMVLVAHNFDSFKVEHRAKERDEIVSKAAKMADEVLMREPDREGHPASLLTHHAAVRGQVGQQMLTFKSLWSVRMFVYLIKNTLKCLNTITISNCFIFEYILKCNVFL